MWVKKLPKVFCKHDTVINEVNWFWILSRIGGINASEILEKKKMLWRNLWEKLVCADFTPLNDMDLTTSFFFNLTKSKNLVTNLKLPKLKLPEGQLKPNYLRVNWPRPWRGLFCRFCPFTRSSLLPWDLGASKDLLKKFPHFHILPWNNYWL